MNLRLLKQKLVIKYFFFVLTQVKKKSNGRPESIQSLQFDIAKSNKDSIETIITQKTGIDFTSTGGKILRRAT